MNFEQIIFSNDARTFRWYYSKLQILSRQKSFIIDFSTPRVLRQLTEPRGAQSVYLVARGIEERWQSSLGGLNRSELRPLLHQFFTEKADRSIDCSRARRRRRAHFPAEKLLISRRVTSH